MSKTAKFQSGDILKSFLASVVKESVAAAHVQRLNEASPFKPDDEEATSGQKPGGEKPPAPQQAAPAAPPAEQVPEKKREAPQKALSPDELKAYVKKQLEAEEGELTVEKIIERLNIIRAGRSLKDETTSQQMAAYFNSLDEAERVALQTFLLGISFVVNPPNDASVAPEPSDKHIKMTIDKTQDDEYAGAVKPASKPQSAPQRAPPSRPTQPPLQRQSAENTDAPIAVKRNIP